jgi:hypothetical protein
MQFDCQIIVNRKAHWIARAAWLRGHPPPLFGQNIHSRRFRLGPKIFVFNILLQNIDSRGVVRTRGALLNEAPRQLELASPTLRVQVLGVGR